MYCPAGVAPKTLLFFTILLTWTVCSGRPDGERTLNLKIGFDLTQGKNGVPALRIRNFEDFKHRADSEEGWNKSHKETPAIRADSFSESKEAKEEARDETSDEEAARKSSNENGYESGGPRVTKGLKAAEYEPEENPSVHGRYPANDDDESEETRRHKIYKRAAIYGFGKRKNKK